MRYIVFLFFLFQIPLKEIPHQSLWESGKGPLLFAGLFPLFHRLGVHRFIPTNSAEEPETLTGLPTQKSLSQGRIGNGGNGGNDLVLCHACNVGYRLSPPHAPN